MRKVRGCFGKNQGTGKVKDCRWEDRVNYLLIGV